MYIKAKNTNLHNHFPESGSRKHLQASGMRAIDSPHEITPQKDDFEEGNRPNSGFLCSLYNFLLEVSGISTPSYSSTSFAPPFIPPPTVPRPEPDIKLNALQYFIDEEMRITERRRIMFCERPVGSLLGASKSCVSKTTDFHQFFQRSV